MENSGQLGCEQPTNVGSGLIRGRSKVWQEFIIVGDGSKVACKRCGDSLSYSHSHSTSSMLKHLKRKHRMDLYPPLSILEEDKSNENKNSPTKQSPEKVKQPKKGGGKGKKSDGNKQAPQQLEEEPPQATPNIQHDNLLFIDPCVRMRWADHSETFLKTFSVMYNDECYTDCTLVAEKTFFKGHRLLLSSASELLDEMFKTTPAMNHPIIFLNNVKAMELRILLDFIYKGEVSIPPNLIPGLVKIGSELKVKGLSDFVWNDQLASTILPQGYTSTNNTESFSPPNTSAGTSFNFKPLSYGSKSSGFVENTSPSSPDQFNLNQGVNYITSVSKPQQQPLSVCHSGVTKTYGRIVTNVRQVDHLSGSASPQQNLGLGILSCNSTEGDQQYSKRMKLLNATSSNSILPSVTTSSNSYVSGFDTKKSTNIPDTVLMVETTSQGGVTLMTPNSISLPMSFAIKDDHQLHSQSGNCQFASGQPVTILSSDGTHGLEEVVYSITEMPGGGHEVLMSGPLPQMDPLSQSPIVVYDTNVTDTADKKLFIEQDDLSKT